MRIANSLVHPCSWVGHSNTSTSSPTQSSPPFKGGGFVQERLRLEVPW